MHRRHFLRSATGTLAFSSLIPVLDAKTPDRASPFRSPDFPRFRGPFPILSTPYKTDGAVDFLVLARSARFMDWCESPGMIWPQSNDSIDLLTQDEKLQGMEVLASTCDHMKTTALCLGVQGRDTDEMLVYAKHAQALKWKLQGTEGFVNGGVQFRSKRLAPPSHEVSGFQADLGMGYDGALYDNARRGKVLLRPTKEVLEKARKPVGEWNDYRIRAEGSRIQIWLNGVQTVDYTETDPTVETTGIIAVQIHGNSTAIVRYKDIVITELTAANAK